MSSELRCASTSAGLLIPSNRNQVEIVYNNCGVLRWTCNHMETASSAREDRSPRNQGDDADTAAQIRTQVDTRNGDARRQSTESVQYTRRLFLDYHDGYDPCVVLETRASASLLLEPGNETTRRELQVTKFVQGRVKSSWNYSAVTYWRGVLQAETKVAVVPASKRQCCER